MQGPVRQPGRQDCFMIAACLCGRHLTYDRNQVYVSEPTHKQMLLVNTATSIYTSRPLVHPVGSRSTRIIVPPSVRLVPVFAVFVFYIIHLHMKKSFSLWF